MGRRANPLVVDDPDDPFTYADYVLNLLAALNFSYGYDLVVTMTAYLLTLTDPGSTKSQRDRAMVALRGQVDELRAQTPPDDYFNALEATLAVACTDAHHPGPAALWPTLADRADRRDPYFGRFYVWSSSPCARAAWTVRDEDAYTGPFDRRTAAPVLVVGNHWDATANYQQAVDAARLSPNSRLVSSDSWGHTAYGSSACLDGTVDSYLVTGEVPAEGTVCVGDVQPFTPPPASNRN